MIPDYCDDLAEMVMCMECEGAGYDLILTDEECAFCQGEGEIEQ